MEAEAQTKEEKIQQQQQKQMNMKQDYLQNRTGYIPYLSSASL